MKTLGQTLRYLLLGLMTLLVSVGCDGRDSLSTTGPAFGQSSQTEVLKFVSFANNDSIAARSGAVDHLPKMPVVSHSPEELVLDLKAVNLDSVDPHTLRLYSLTSDGLWAAVRGAQIRVESRWCYIHIPPPLVERSRYAIGHG